MSPIMRFMNLSGILATLALGLALTACDESYEDNNMVCAFCID